MFMKKLLAMLLMVSVLFALAACGSGGNGGGSGADAPMFHRIWSVIGTEHEGTAEEVGDVFENFGVVVLDVEVDDSGTPTVFTVEFEFNPGSLDIGDYLANLEDALYASGFERW